MNVSFSRSAVALGAVRAGVHGVFLATIGTTDFSALGRLPVTIMHPPGVMEYLSWKFYDRLITPQGMVALKCLLMVSLLLSTIGFCAGLTTKTSALLVILYEGILRSFGHFNADEMIGIYFLIVLALSPCGDGFALDARGRAPPRRPAFAYGYPILLMQVLLAWAYCSAGLLKLRLSGLGYFHPDNLATMAIRQSLDNLHDSHSRLALWLPSIRPLIPVGLAIVVAWEILFPLAVVLPRLRWFILGFGLVFHISAIFVMNIAFPIQLSMYLVFVDWPLVACRFCSYAAVAKLMTRWYPAK